MEDAASQQRKHLHSLFALLADAEDILRYYGVSCALSEKGMLRYVLTSKV